MTNNITPLVLVFYVYRDIITQPDIMKPFIDSVNFLIEKKGFNVMALFVPTDDNERIECLNPAIMDDNQKDRINLLIDDISNNFSIKK